ncbi:DUF397 domain-containing protein [Nocardia donostiensis]|uniref:DUF397 domain-containing protein n=1 Tax=Nocardia donostiensis TaxID=1538463 RepID=A0A1W0BK40_9NOCA|nr:DUF397 domain-containing protein [Nocardia donostiensis]ONM48891.1 hypothetical protein B0T46_10520 [Nocardia donostiensis]OQS15489.1 hypothetical protein B0T36_09520 [Nocardia donostiensis]OQS22853.1 hypothetical protein B0T44_03945 [Nocardia donostiensis]
MNEEPPAPSWFKSSRSQGNKECVEVAFFDLGTVGVRDSKNRGGPALRFTPSQWDAFTADVAKGRFQQFRGSPL